MSVCKCPACQAQFQAPDDRLATTLTCPDCRFQIRLPQLKQGAGASAPDMITCECPACRIKFQVHQSLAGTTRRCPDCNQPVPVVGPRKGSLGVGVWVIASFILILAWVVFQDSVFLKPAPTTWGGIGKSIGVTVTAGPWQPGQGQWQAQIEFERLPMPKLIPEPE
jgi:hypothetical protein